MKLLLTSGGVTNQSIHSALLQLLGKPVGDSTALVHPHGAMGPPDVRAGLRARFRQRPARRGAA